MIDQALFKRRKKNQLTPALFIRLHVLNLSQKEVAWYLGVSQRCISLYESTGQIPEAHKPKYRTLAMRRGRRIPDEWFNVVPVPSNITAEPSDIILADWAVA